MSPMKRGRNTNEQMNATADDATTVGDTRTNAYASGQKGRNAKKGSALDQGMSATLHITSEHQNEFPNIARDTSKTKR